MLRYGQVRKAAAQACCERASLLVPCRHSQLLHLMVFALILHLLAQLFQLALLGRCRLLPFPYLCASMASNWVH